ncbi:MAG TPA: DUF4234 domain-containing protein [Clostridia bacterium]|nr:DUF4234 domain-containing protein [Clostridia bacterium]
MKKCVNGHSVPDNATFCALCGAPVAQATQQQAGAPPSQQAPYQHQQQPPYQQPTSYGYQQPPYQQQPLTGFRGQIKSPGMIILLTILTCGIYGIIWMYSISEEINAVLGDANATSSIYPIIGLFTCGIFTFIWMSQVDKAMVEIDRRRGIYSESKFLVWILLSVFLGIGLFMVEYDVQSRLNALYGGTYA